MQRRGRDSARKQDLPDVAAGASCTREEFRRQLAWRDFCADLLARHPDAAWKPLRPEFERMAYDEPGAEFDAWCSGQTGFPIVDAGMRQLAGEGFVHNRVRMLVASFLVKDLHVHWRYGARWFMRRLRDGDLASNSLNWQWVAGCGADAAPYFRIFNPVTQGLKFDPDGDYVRRWVPELRSLSGPTAHEPWKHGGANGYPGPITDHAEARSEALRRYTETAEPAYVLRRLELSRVVDDVAVLQLSPSSGHDCFIWSGRRRSAGGQ